METEKLLATNNKRFTPHNLRLQNGNIYLDEFELCCVLNYELKHSADLLPILTIRLEIKDVLKT